MVFDNMRLYEALTVPGFLLMVVLAILTMRTVVKRDRAMLFGKGNEESRRLSYENTWRNNRLTGA
jgi:hypothetical protein